MEDLSEKETEEMEAAFENSFNGDDIIVEEEPKEEEPNEEEPGQEEPEAIEEPAKETGEPIEEPSGMTREELESSFNNLTTEFGSLRDKMNGRTGGLEKKLKDIQEMKTSMLSPKAKERLQDEFPELSELLFGGQDEIVEDKPVVYPDPIQAEEPEPGLDDSQKKAIELLTEDHSDWETIKSSNEFKEFINSKGAAEKHKFNNSWDAAYLSKLFTGYKTAQKEAGDKETASKAKAVKKNEARRKRLTSAITPRGSGVISDIDVNDEEAAMEAAFNS